MSQPTDGPVVNLSIGLDVVNLIIRGLRKLPHEEVDGVLRKIAELSQEAVKQYDAAKAAPVAAPAQPAPAAKGKPGRPKKAVAPADAATPTKQGERRPGRPKKTPDAVAPVAKKPGRPKKAAAPAAVTELAAGAPAASAESNASDAILA